MPCFLTFLMTENTLVFIFETGIYFCFYFGDKEKLLHAWFWNCWSWCDADCCIGLMISILRIIVDVLIVMGDIVMRIRAVEFRPENYQILTCFWWWKFIAISIVSIVFIGWHAYIYLETLPPTSFSESPIATALLVITDL